VRTDWPVWGRIARGIRARARPVALLAALLMVDPNLKGDIVSQIEGAVVSFFRGIWNGISSFFGTIFSAIANLFADFFSAPASAISESWVSFENWVNQFGVLAPLFTVLMVAAFVGIAVLIIWLIVKFSVSEGEQTAEEAEEGV
jgi:hypothetical protein